MALQRAVLVTDVLEDNYFSDAFSNEFSDEFSNVTGLLDEMDTDTFLSVSEPANEDIWDVLDISADEWNDLQTEGFFIP